MNIGAAFKLFDIRGKYPSEVDERLAFLLGKAITLLKRPKKVLVGSDTRESSPILKTFLIDGLTAGEAQVFDLFEVSDQGPGMDKEVLEHLFDEFYRGPNQKKEGLGIGLYLTKKIVEAHKGKISVQSKLNKGTKITITLPQV